MEADLVRKGPRLNVRARSRPGHGLEGDKAATT